MHDAKITSHTTLDDFRQGSFDLLTKYAILHVAKILDRTLLVHYHLQN